MDLLSENTQYNLLDWNECSSLVASFSYFDLTKENLNLPPVRINSDEIETLFDALEFILNCFDELIERASFDKIVPENDFSAIDLIEKGRILNFKELNFLSSLFETFDKVISDIKHWHYLKIICGEFDFDKLNLLKHNFINRLRVFLTDTGDVVVERIPEAKEIYYSILSLEKSIREQLSKIYKSKEFRSTIQYEGYDIINDYYVIPIRSDSYNREMGSIISRSSTGNTLFIAPLSLKMINYDLICLKYKLEGILSSLAEKYSEIVSEFYYEFRQIEKVVLSLDEFLAKALYVRSLKLTRPRLSDKFDIVLNDFFHPLIENAVTNSITIKEEEFGLVISGPNTGGKTVALKSIVLAHLFIHKGLFVPAGDATLFPNLSIHFFSNDLQDIMKGRSSFEGEVYNYLNLLSFLKKSSDPALIVIDEIFNSTSSEEASALGLAFIKEVLGMVDAKLIISTHHQMFKTFVHSKELSSFVSAHVGYDERREIPTYKLQIGTPGSSMAITIFKKIEKKLNVISSITDVAKSFLSQKQLTYEALLEDLSRDQMKLNYLIDENRDLNRNLKQKNKMLEGELLLKKEMVLDKYEQKISKLFNKLNTLYNDVKSKSLIKEFSKEECSIRRELVSERDMMTGDSLSQEERYKIIPNIEDIKRGDKFFSIFLNKEVTINKIFLQQLEVEVSCRNTRIRLPFNSLRVLNEVSTQKREEEKISFFRDSDYLEKEVSLEVDCRGLRLDMFKGKIEAIVDSLILEEVPFVTVVHGHGNGILKKWLRETYLKDSQIMIESIEGNDGATRLKLKN